MVKKNFRFALSAVSFISVIFAMSASITGAPVRFSQVTQIVNVKPGKANAANYTRLYLPGNVIGDDGDEDKKSKPVKQDDRVITETSVEIIETEDCNCTQIPVGGVSPYFALLGLGALPIFFIADNDPTPTPTPPPTGSPTPPPTGSPTPPPTGSPTPTPTGSPTPTPTETPTMTPTPTPPTEPVPEPITLLLFGTGLAGIGLAARRRLGGKEESED